MLRFFTVVIVAVSLGGFSHASDGSNEVITFADHIAPIIYENCAVCHRPGGVGPFSLLTFEDVRRRSVQISEVITSRFMPPWKPAEGFGPKFIGERRLREDEIEMINRWVDLEAPPGDLNEAPPPPEFTGEWQLGEPDLILEFAEPYALPAEGMDIYRNFVIPAPVSRKRYVRAMEFLPRSNLAIHHAVLQIDRTPTSREKDVAEPGPGYDGMGIGAAAPPAGQFVGWTPGQRPYQSYPDTAWTLQPGDDVVIQLHMLPRGKTENVSPRIGLYFTDEPPTRSSFVLQMRNYEIDIPAGETDYRFEEVMNIPVEIEVIGVYPHAHYIGKDLGAYAIFPDGSKHWLFRIPDWDFNWQSDYRYVEPLRLPAGSTLHMEYSYDNSSDNFRNPNQPPQRIVSGWRSVDEMGELSIQVLPVKETDLEALKQAQIDYEVERAGGLSRYTYNLGSYFERQGLLEKAGSYYRESIQHDPEFASGHFKLGHVLERQGDTFAAEKSYLSALEHRSELIPPRLGLARIYVQRGRKAEAMKTLQQVLAWEDFHYEARAYIARIHESNDDLDQAIDILEQGISYHQDNPYFRLELGKLLFKSGDHEKAVPHLKFASENEVTSNEPVSQRDASVLKSEALFSLGVIFMKSEEYLSAQSYFSGAVDVMPHHQQALIASAVVATEAEDIALAELRIEQIRNLPEGRRPSKRVLARYSANEKWKSIINERYE